MTVSKFVKTIKIDAINDVMFIVSVIRAIFSREQ